MLRTFIPSVARGVREFPLDFIDRTARRKPKTVSVPDSWLPAFLAIGAVLSYVDRIQAFVTSTLGVPATVLPLIFSVLSVFLCTLVVASKTTLRSEIVTTDLQPVGWDRVYHYGQPVRILAKVALLVSVLLVFVKGQNLYIEVRPLPTTLYGYVVDYQTGDGVPEATIRIVNAKGTDITSGTWKSDSEGFFVVKTTNAPMSQDRLLVVHKDCQLPKPIALMELPPSNRIERKELAGPRLLVFVECK